MAYARCRLARAALSFASPTGLPARALARHKARHVGPACGWLAVKAAVMRRHAAAFATSPRPRRRRCHISLPVARRSPAELLAGPGGETSKHRFGNNAQGFAAGTAEQQGANLVLLGPLFPGL